MTPSQLTVEDYRCDCKYRYKCTLQAALIVQVAQLSQRDRATGWVSFGRNISSNPLAISFIAEHRTGCRPTRCRAGALVFSKLCEYRHKSYC